MKNDEKACFPLFISLEDKKIVIIGGGKIASRRSRILADFCPDITVVSLDFSEELLDMEREGKAKLIKKAYGKEDIKGAFCVLSATDSPDTDFKVYKDCKEEGIIVNVAGDKNLCDFYFPGIVKEDNLVAGLCASGKDHKKVKQLREAVERGMKEVMGDKENEGAD